jgi:hypothetical protein
MKLDLYELLKKKVIGKTEDFLVSNYCLEEFSYLDLEFLDKNDFLIFSSYIQNREFYISKENIPKNTTLSNSKNFLFGVKLFFDFQGVKGFFILRCDKINSLFYKLTASQVLTTDLDIVATSYLNREEYHNFSFNCNNASRIGLNLQQLQNSILRIDSQIDLDFSLILDIRFIEDEEILYYFLSSCKHIRDFLPICLNNYLQKYNHLRPNINFFPVENKEDKKIKRVLKINIKIIKIIKIINRVSGVKKIEIEKIVKV